MSLSESQLAILSWIFTMGSSILLIASTAIILYMMYLFVKLVKNFSKKYWRIYSCVIYIIKWESSIHILNAGIDLQIVNLTRLILYSMWTPSCTKNQPPIQKDGGFLFFRKGVDKLKNSYKIKGH